MNTKILISIIGLSFVIACNPPKSEKILPIMGRTEYIDNDTIYHTVKDFEFINQDSAIVNQATFDGKIYVTDFFFTSCPTICPIMKTQMLRVYDVIKDYEDVAILSHTIDPEYDTVALLKDFAERLGVSTPKWHFVTGDKNKIFEQGQRSYMVTAVEDKTAPGGAIHSGAFILVDKDKHIRGYYDGTLPEKVDILIRDIALLRREYETK
ncbi:MAG: SCO family protein [Cyclobacteriaceae bacterium]|nr:SCO family protein [Cyclobacteriaceae bacterium]